MVFERVNNRFWDAASSLATPDTRSFRASVTTFEDNPIPTSQYQELSSIVTAHYGLILVREQVSSEADPFCTSKLIRQSRNLCLTLNAGYNIFLTGIEGKCLYVKISTQKTDIFFLQTLSYNELSDRYYVIWAEN
jgi:hypothetical protein